MSSNTTVSTVDSESVNNNYPFEKKKKLATKISNMKNKVHLRKIRDIIFNENPGVTGRKSSSGYLMYFHNYTPETYRKIDKYIENSDADLTPAIT